MQPQWRRSHNPILNICPVIEHPRHHLGREDFSVKEQTQFSVERMSAEELRPAGLSILSSMRSGLMPNPESLNTEAGSVTNNP
jgi:hypothetical protein